MRKENCFTKHFMSRMDIEKVKPDMDDDQIDFNYRLLEMMFV